MIKYTSQRSVARWFTCGGTFDLLYYKVTNEFVLKKILKLHNIWQSYGGKVDCLKCPVSESTVLLKDKELASDWTRSGHKQL